ncbi:MAG: hypothetical protein AB1758_25985, partial [Candidatus Eremiobacterota bacterium]
DHALGILHDRLSERSRRRVVFLDMDLFPQELPFFLNQGPGWHELSFQPSGQEPVDLKDIVSLCVNGMHVSQDAGVGFSPDDFAYLSVECWASLFAVCSTVSRTGLVANFVAQREFTACRFSRLAYLSRFGVPIPRLMVTSNPASVREFFRQQQGRVECQAVVAGKAPRVMEVLDLERAEQVRLAPVQFESRHVGQSVWLAIVGDRAISCPAHVEGPPAEVQQACVDAARSLGLKLAEVFFRRTETGAFVAHDLYSFLTPGILAAQPVLESALNLLEEGK